MKRENEAVVNRFLLSTLYIILGEFLLFFMYKGETSLVMVMQMPGILYTLMGIAVLGIIACVVLKIMGKKNTCYYLTLSIAVLIIALFLKFSYVIDIKVPFYINIVGQTSKRYGAMAIFAGLLYIYEIVYYFINVNKVQK